MICPHCKTEHPLGNALCGAGIRHTDIKAPPVWAGGDAEPGMAPRPATSHGCLCIRVEGTEIRLQVGNRYEYKPAFKAEVRTSHGVLLADCVCSVEETAVKSATEAALAVWRGPQWEGK